MTTISQTPINQKQTIPHTLKKTKLIWIFLITLFGFGLYQITGYLFNLAFDFEQLPYAIMIGISTLINLSVFSLIFYIFGIKGNRFSTTSVGLKTKKFEWWWLALIPAIVIAAIPFRSVIGIGIEYLIHGDFSGLTARSEMLIPTEFNFLTMIISLIGIGILAPIGEELFFRGFIHTSLKDHFPFWLRVIISSLIFAFGHYDSIGVMATSFIMGIILAIAYEKCQSIWFSIGIHIFNNSISIFLIYAGLFLQKFLDIPIN